jgi:hypothetical protein
MSTKILTLLFTLLLLGSICSATPLHPFNIVKLKSSVDFSPLRNMDSTGKAIAFTQVSGEECCHYYSQKDASMGVSLCKKSGSSTSTYLAFFRTYTDQERADKSIKDSATAKEIVTFELGFLKNHSVIGINDSLIDTVMSSMQNVADLAGASTIEFIVFDESVGSADYLDGVVATDYLDGMPEKKNIGEISSTLYLNTSKFGIRILAQNDGSFLLSGLNPADSFQIFNLEGKKLAFQYSNSTGKLFTDQTISYLVFQNGDKKGLIMKLAAPK